MLQNTLSSMARPDITNNANASDQFQQQPRAQKQPIFSQSQQFPPKQMQQEPQESPAADLHQNNLQAQNKTIQRPPPQFKKATPNLNAIQQQPTQSQQF